MSDSDGNARVGCVGLLHPVRLLTWLSVPLGSSTRSKGRRHEVRSTRNRTTGDHRRDDVQRRIRVDQRLAAGRLREGDEMTYEAPAIERRESVVALLRSAVSS